MVWKPGLWWRNAPLCRLSLRRQRSCHAVWSVDPPLVSDYSIDTVLTMGTCEDERYTRVCDVVVADQ